MAEKAEKFLEVINILSKLSQYKSLKGNVKDNIIEALNITKTMRDDYLEDAARKKDEGVQEVPRPSYSQILQHQPLRKAEDTSYKILLKGSDSKSPEEIKTEFKKHINPRTLKIGIKNIKCSRNGFVIVESDKKADIAKITSTLSTEAKNIVVTEIKKLHPRIIIKNIPEEINADNIVPTICEQNEELNITSEHIKLIRIFEIGSTKRRHAILETNASARMKLLSVKIKMAYEMRYAEDYFSVKRCRKCSRLHHLSKDCRSEQTVCPDCCGPHAKKDCDRTAELQCVNCVAFNKYAKPGQRVDVKHSSLIQVYKGLSVTTNKVTTEECQGVPHHCLDFVDPLENYTVIDFRDKALPIIEDLMKKGKLPVVVGGTHYYIEAIVSDALIGGGEGLLEPQEPGPLGPKGKLKILLEEMGFIITTGKLSCEEVKSLESAVGQGTSTLDLEGTTEEELAQLEERTRDAMKIVEMHHPDKIRLANRLLHARLREVDPERAEQLHYNDTRKVKRSLEIFSENGVKHSELLRRQRETAGGSHFGGPLRFPGRTAFLWLNADPEVLNKRLDARVDDMLKQGLLEELEAFHATYGKDNPSPKYTHGIFQTIGLKEFQSYLDDEKGFSKGKLAECVEGLKIATRRYARRQIKWIRGRFLKAHGRQVPPVYKLDATDLEKWDEKVLAPATAVVQHFLGLPLDSEKLPIPVQRIQQARQQNNKEERICKTCMRVFIGNLQWENHLTSKKHQAFVKKKEKRAQSISSETTPEQC